jgi:hypothetical protein
MLAILLLIMGWERMAIWERWFVRLLVAASITFHIANLLIVLATPPALALMYLLGWRPGPQLEAFNRSLQRLGKLEFATTILVS